MKYQCSVSPIPFVAKDPADAKQKFCEFIKTNPENILTINIEDGIPIIPRDPSISIERISTIDRLMTIDTRYPIWSKEFQQWGYWVWEICPLHQPIQTKIAQCPYCINHHGQVQLWIEAKAVSIYEPKALKELQKNCIHKFRKIVVDTEIREGPPLTECKECGKSLEGFYGEEE